MKLPLVRAAAAFAAGALLSFSSPRAGAETLELTLEDTIRRAVEASPDARIARQEVTLAEAQVADARILVPANPVAEGSVARRDGGDFGDDWSAGASLELYVPGQRGAALSAARHRLDAARRRLRQDVRRIGTEAGTFFIDALLAAERAKLAEESERLALELLAAAQARADAGASSALELNLAQVERGRAALGRIEADRESLSAKAELRRALALPPETDVRVVGELARAAKDAPIPEIDLARLLEEARSGRGDLAATELERTAATRDLLAARLGLLPRPTVFGEVEQDDGQDIARLGLSIPIPLFQRQQGPRRTARARLEQARAVSAAVSAEVERDVARAAAHYDASRAAVRVFDRQVLGALEDNATLLGESYRAGKIDFIQVLVLRRDVLETRSRYLEALAEYRRAVLEIDLAVGREISKEVPKESR